MGQRGSKLSSEQLTELTKCTLFTKKEIMEWHSGFLREFPGGSLLLDDVCRIFKQFFPFGDSLKLAQHLFTIADMNEDGIVDFKEFIQTLSHFVRGNAKDRVKWLFKLYDMDEDGRIGKAELLYIIDMIYRTVGDLSEFPSQQETPEDRANVIFDQMDLDKDGYLSIEEFELGCIRDSAISEAMNFKFY
jgi:Ca2+-binding EF-hand superfamily protein